MVEPRLTAAEATAQIIGLINAKPTSPWPHEIEAIIARVEAPANGNTATLGAITPALASAFAEWETARDHYDAASDLYGRTDDEEDRRDAKRWSDVFTEKSQVVLELGAQSLADLQLLFPVVVYWNSPLHVKSPPYPHCTIEKGGDDEGDSLEPKSPAYFIRTVMELLGKLVCADGGPNLSTDYAEFVAAANSMHAFGRTGPREPGPEHDAWEEQFSKLGDQTSERAEQILKSANPDPRALAAIIWHFLADASLERGIDLSNLPEPLNFGIGQDAAVLLAARILQRRG